MLKWDDSLATGEESIDQQHRRLFHFVNHLEDSVRDNPGTPLQRETLEFLETYVQVHFASEELCMFRNACGVATQNKLAHEAFLSRVERLVSGEESLSAADLLAFLQKWISGHIMAVDRRMNECVDATDRVW